MQLTHQEDKVHHNRFGDSTDVSRPPKSPSSQSLPSTPESRRGVPVKVYRRTRRGDYLLLKVLFRKVLVRRVLTPIPSTV